MESLIVQPPGESKWQKIKGRIKKPRVYIPIILLVLFLAVFASLVNRYYLGSKQEKSGLRKAGFLGLQLKSEPSKQSLLDGLNYPESAADRHPLGIMIENHTASRPQSGLGSASVIYEAIAEGGITRFLAVFGPKLPPKAGPVRSARPYYLDWCLEYDCFYAHVGGSTEALEAIKQLGIKDLDQFRYGTRKHGKTYYRESRKGVATEHTMFSDPTKLYELASNNNWPLSGGFPDVTFKNDAASRDRPASQQAKVDISSRQYNVVWDYDPSTNTYKRTMGGTAHRDALTNEQLTAKVVIVQEVPSQTNGNNSLKMQTTGGGKAVIFQDGQRTDASWEKAGQRERTIFRDTAGQELRFNRGRRWIMVVSPGTNLTTP